MSSINEIRPVYFKWNELGLKQFPVPEDHEDTVMGFIAQDFESNFPELIAVEKGYKQYDRNYLQVVMLKQPLSNAVIFPANIAETIFVQYLILGIRLNSRFFVLTNQFTFVYKLNQIFIECHFQLS